MRYWKILIKTRKTLQQFRKKWSDCFRQGLMKAISPIWSPSISMLKWCWTKMIEAAAMCMVGWVPIVCCMFYFTCQMKILTKSIWEICKNCWNILRTFKAKLHPEREALLVCPPSTAILGGGEVRVPGFDRYLLPLPGEFATSKLSRKLDALLLSPPLGHWQSPIAEMVASAVENSVKSSAPSS